MADEILIKYGADITDIVKAEKAVTNVTESVVDLQQKVKVAFTQKELDQAVQKLMEMGQEVDALVLKYGSAQKAFKGATKELADMAVAGQQGTKAYKDLEKAAAELEDTIQDTRNSIKKLSSDTRLIDSVAQGMRGLAAAGSVVAGAMATFGNENEEVQKTLLKVQGAMATLQGVQELATIATEKGGIATQAYGLALQAVDRISKLTGASMEASWALATGGITLVIGAIVGLIYWLNTAEDETFALTKEQQVNSDEIEGLRIKYEEATGAISAYGAATKQLAIDSEKALSDLNKKVENEIIASQTTLGQSFLNLFDSYTGRIEASENRRASIRAGIEKKYQKDKEQLEEEARLRQGILDANEAKRQAEALKRANEQRLREMMSARRKELDLLNREVDFKTIEPKELKSIVTEAQKQIDKIPALLLKIELKPLSAKEQLQQFRDEFLAFAPVLTDTVNQLSSFSSSIYANQLSQLEKNKAEELRVVGDNAEAQKKIEQKYAIESARIKRRQAELDRGLAVTGIIIQLAKTISEITLKASSQAASGPIGAALSAASFAKIGVAVAGAALQTAAILSAPLPEIPTFEKGGPVVLAGGRNNDGHLQGRSHRQGGMLINAQGGEYIWDIPTVKRHGDLIKAAHENRLEDLILHQYVAPLLEKSTIAAGSSASQYDDFMLRATIKQGHDKDRRNAEYIAEKVSTAVTASMFNKTRYN